MGASNLRKVYMFRNILFDNIYALSDLIVIMGFSEDP